MKERGEAGFRRDAKNSDRDGRAPHRIQDIINFTESGVAAAAVQDAGARKGKYSTLNIQFRRDEPRGS